MNSASNIKVAGFGGQGVMMFGQILAYSATKDELFGLWFPSYGPETRGGTANCSVIVSNEEINSPIFKNSDHLVAFNGPSLEKFKKNVSPKGLILYNSSIITEAPKGCDQTCLGVPINDIAIELGNAKVANMVMMGAYLELTKMFSDETILAVVKKILGEKKAHLLELNEKALEAGKAFVRNASISYA
ncbi:MAG: 2-oxoacid:acceptor oxidoreductase family protein [Tenericutes bacterium]|nr:2-oxoacid:acceptor oxidoreductase family protein [Mycoplasmatota bacterium]